MNGSIFPNVAMPVLAGTFNDLDGRTGGPADRRTVRAGEAGGWSPVMEAYLAEVDRLVRTPLWETAGRRIVIGHSFGGMLALAWLAGRGTAEVHGLLLIGAAAGPMYHVARLRVAGAGSRALRIPIAPLMPLWDSTVVTALVKRILGTGPAGGEVDFREYAGRSDLAIGIAGWRMTSSAAKHSYRAAMDGFDVRRHLDRIDVPAVVLHGTRDAFFAPAVAQELSRGLPRATLRLIDGAGHMLPLSHPDEVTRAVQQLPV